jgi:FkbM family methyltransferase
LCILSTHYRGLLLQDVLKYRYERLPFRSARRLNNDPELAEYEVQGVRVFWPTEFADTNLGELHKEVFTPEHSNPHAYILNELDISPGDWVIDAGACEGFFTHLALQKGANVLAIEPVPELARALTHTFAGDIKSGRVRVLQAGIGDETGEMRLSVPRDAVYCASVDLSGDVIAPVYTVDDLVDRGIAPRVDFLKMDIEGMEVTALLGATDTMHTQTPKLAIAVYHAYRNAQAARSIVRAARPDYHVGWRGIFFKRGFGSPRPYMLHARVLGKTNLTANLN